MNFVEEFQQAIVNSLSDDRVWNAVVNSKRSNQQVNWAVINEKYEKDLVAIFNSIMKQNGDHHEVDGEIVLNAYKKRTGMITTAREIYSFLDSVEYRNGKFIAESFPLRIV